MGQEHGPFEYIVGSDVLYGDRAPPGPLIDALVSLSLAQRMGKDGQRGAPAEIILAVKNRCADETRAFCKLAATRGLWDTRLAASEDFLDDFHGLCSYCGQP